ncbi:MAG: hypothetical protein Q9227_003405 [Pyrenula ochraceoflavens]
MASTTLPVPAEPQLPEKSTPQTPPSAAQSLGITGPEPFISSQLSGPLTPPMTPVAPRAFSPTDSIGSTIRSSSDTSQGFEALKKSGILLYPFEISTWKDARGRTIEYGRGAWSTVCKASVQQSTAVMLPTPPTSPQSSPLIVALKSPSSRTSRTILRHEARILTHLHDTAGFEKYIVPFYGYVESSSAIVMSPIPLTLSSYLMDRASKLPSGYPRTEPIIGSPHVWLNIAHHLISALHWLHNTAETAHGDLKPHNILLQPSSDSMIPLFLYRPVLVDFSSSHHSSIPIASDAFSAITREYAAPELLTLSVLQDPNTVPTASGDVFSLGVTLLAAATGNVGIYSGPIYIKNAKATQGWAVMDFMRSEDGGARIPRDGVVEKAVAPALRKKDEGRIKTAQWQALVQGMIATECLPETFPT